MDKTKNKKTKLVFLLFITFFMLEIISYLFCNPEEKKLPPSKHAYINRNIYLQDFYIKSGCTWNESIIVHPMLGYVHRQPQYMSWHCNKSTSINNIGIFTKRDLPLIKSKNEFAVIILGGSVAHQLAETTDADGSIHLETLLNKTFYSPTGKPFRVYTGAIGAWAMPNQVNMLLMYGERFDAAIAVDGYNEAFPVQGGTRLEKQWSTAIYILSNESYTSFKHLFLRGLWNYQYVLSRTWLQHSYFFNAVYKILTGIFQKVIVSNSLLQEFSEGNNENLKLNPDEAKRWSLEHLNRYLINFHEIGKINGIRTAQFLQPTRLYGKSLTDSEKSYHEFINKEAYQSIEVLYRNLEKKKYPIKSLTGIFKNHPEEIYGDHIHFKPIQKGASLGNQILAQNIIKELGELWHLKKK